MDVPQKLKIELLYDAAVLLLGIYPKEMKSVSQRDICIPRFTAALFTIPKIRNNPSIYQQMSKKNIASIIYIYTHIYKCLYIYIFIYIFIYIYYIHVYTCTRHTQSHSEKRRKFWHLWECAILKDTTLSEKSQTQKETYCIISHRSREWNSGYQGQG